MKTTKKLERVTIRFAGDSGDGMQLTGTQFTRTTAMAKNDLSTVPDFPAEIRAPAGTLYGVSGFQIQFSSEMIHTPGDQADVLVAMNPAALKSGLRYLKKGGTIIVNTDAFTSRNLRMADFEDDPIDNGFLEGYEVFSVEMTRLTKDALEGLELTHKEKERCKNFFALGMIYWLYNRSIDPTLAWIEEKFHKKPVWVEANKRALRGGRNFADMTEIFTVNYEVPEAKIEPGIYRRITGNEALSLGLVAVSNKSDVEILYCSYPITPASDILQHVSNYKNYGVKSFQTEDEIAAIGAAIGASFAGNLGVTGTSGPGFALKAEFAGLAVICELPLLIVDVQRGGPSTGMPTKPEQTDLMQGMYGRNGEAPIPIIAADSPADCFQTVYDAARVAFQFMTPVLILSDAYLANGAEPWRIPDIDAIPEIKPNFAEPGKPYLPYERDDDSLARKWALPGMPGLEHRIGGLERQENTGNVSYDPENHMRMTEIRAEKIEKINDFVEGPELHGSEKGDVLVISWGSTYGTVRTAVEQLQRAGKEISYIHLRWLNPLPKVLDTHIKNFKEILIPEMNMGQLSQLIRSKYAIDAKGFNRVTGQPLVVAELKEAIENLL